MENKIEIARSFSFKLSLPNYQNADFFCSQKKECLESEAGEASKALYEFCRNEVIRDVNEYKKQLKPTKVVRSKYAEVKKEQEETSAKIDAADGILGEQKLKE